MKFTSLRTYACTECSTSMETPKLQWALGIVHTITNQKDVIRTPREVTSERCYTGIGFVTVRCSVFDSVKKKKINFLLVPFPIPVPVFFISVPCSRALDYLSVFCWKDRKRNLLLPTADTGTVSGVGARENQTGFLVRFRFQHRNFKFRFSSPKDDKSDWISKLSGVVRISFYPLSRFVIPNICTHIEHPVSYCIVCG